MYYKALIHNPIYGVPSSFLDKYCPQQFEIMGLTSSSKKCTYGLLIGDNTTIAMINGDKLYARILIRHRKAE